MNIMPHEGLQERPHSEKPTADPAGPSLLNDLRLNTGYLLARLGADSRGLWGRMLSERGLTPHQFGVLMALAQLGEAHQQRLVAIIGVDPRNAVGIMDGLSERALLERTIDPNDRRRHLIRLTPKGAAVVAELRDTGAAIEDQMFDGLDRGERDALHALLLKLFDARMRL
jgi:DNA-binding MarR family transcriptional regulator